MSIMDWAEQECRIACKRENPNFNFDDDKAFDYGCSCYKSALKAYKSLCNDGHSGYSFSITRNILIRLMEDLPLTPITDEDFFKNAAGKEHQSLIPDEYLKERGLKSYLQCPRMSSLFREETLDGKVSYHDNNRAYFVNVENPSDTYHSWDRFLDEMFPITMPYMPGKDKYVIYTQTFLTDRKNGDFDTKGILYMDTPKSERVALNIFMTEKDGKMVEITKEEYDELLRKRIDTLDKKVADELIFTLISNLADDNEIIRREAAWKNRDEYIKQNDITRLTALCSFFNEPEHWQYNTFSMRQALCRGKEEKYKDIPELIGIAKLLKSIIVAISE